MVSRLFRSKTMRVLLSECKWYRRWYGGVWEQWYVDSPVNRTVWHNVVAPTAETGVRPAVICRGTPTVEDYREGAGVTHEC